ncbi:uncharacterized protein N7511_003529 [Penicillium nucicola]|uniref:uncharacterized protein n=1 Tax=Penicillium nucicola TaxID=1850975 RepID=UPI0025453ADE|nr:uncharacterized protein N7511_003529 [Penicillium nucicola]KAJ5771478.1 hypothetical protein N7511_003529 [Penicillium nucicola]
MCDADVCVGIHFRETGQLHLLSAHASGVWTFLTSQLGSYYPTPRLITDRDLETRGGTTVTTAVLNPIRHYS